MKEQLVIAVVARLKVQDGKADEFEAAAKEMVAAVAQAEAGRTLMYTLHRAKDDPNTFVFYEQYADEDALAAHRGTEHMAAFGAKIRGLFAERPEIVQYEPVTSLAHPSPGPSTSPPRSRLAGSRPSADRSS